MCLKRHPRHAVLAHAIFLKLEQFVWQSLRQQLADWSADDLGFDATGTSWHKGDDVFLTSFCCVIGESEVLAGWLARANLALLAR